MSSFQGGEDLRTQQYRQLRRNTHYKKHLYNTLALCWKHSNKQRCRYKCWGKIKAPALCDNSFPVCGSGSTKISPKPPTTFAVCTCRYTCLGRPKEVKHGDTASIATFPRACRQLFGKAIRISNSGDRDFISRAEKILDYLTAQR